MEWWFVEATDRDPGAGAALGKAYDTERDAWPPRLAEGAASADPVRAGLPGPLPDRPADLPKLRRRHRARQLVARSGGVGIALAVGWLTVRGRSGAPTRGRRRRTHRSFRPGPPPRWPSRERTVDD